MIHKLINMLNISLHSEPDFFINKLDEIHFSVKARNGLNASITIDNDIMFVDIFSAHENSLIQRSSNPFSRMKKDVVRYSTPINDSDLTVDEFVIKSIKNTILFKLEKSRISTYFNEFSYFFKDFSIMRHYQKFIHSDLETQRYLNYMEDSIVPEYNCIYEYNVFEEKCYPIIHFRKKEVINNLFKYKFSAIKREDESREDSIIAYCIDGVFFDICNLNNFFFHKAIKNHAGNFQFLKYNLNSHVRVNQEVNYGINNQLNDNQSFLSKHIDLSKVQVLRRDGQQYCLLKKENRQLTLSYITNFDIEKTVVDGVLTYSSWWQKMLRNETPLRRYKNEYLITYTYLDGKLTKKTERFDLDMVTKHEMDIINQVMTNAAYLKTHYPSDLIVNRLNEFGICSDIPLSLDDLSVLEMCVI